MYKHRMEVIRQKVLIQGGCGGPTTCRSAALRRVHLIVLASQLDTDITAQPNKVVVAGEETYSGFTICSDPGVPVTSTCDCGDVRRSFGGVAFISSPSLSLASFSCSSKLNASERLTAKNVFGNLTLLRTALVISHETSIDTFAQKRK
jgi:hypothetical protein